MISRAISFRTHRVGAHDAATQFQRSQQRGNCRDLPSLRSALRAACRRPSPFGRFVGFVGHFELPQDKSIAGCPSIDDEAHVPAVLAGCAEGFAVDGDDFPVDVFAHALRPPHEALVKTRRIDQRKHAIERVVAGDAVGQLRKQFGTIFPWPDRTLPCRRKTCPRTKASRSRSLECRSTHGSECAILADLLCV